MGAACPGWYPLYPDRFKPASENAKTAKCVSECVELRRCEVGLVPQQCMYDSDTVMRLPPVPTIPTMSSSSETTFNSSDLARSLSHRKRCLSLDCCLLLQRLAAAPA